MYRKSIIVPIIALAAILVVAGCAYAFSHRNASDSATSPVGGTLVIKNSGSTNTKGWNLTIESDGSGSLTEGGTDADSFKAGTFDTATFRTDLQKIGSMDKLQPSGQLMKSASFGTTEHATYQGKTSGDLNESYDTSPSNVKALHALLKQFVAQSGAKNIPAHPVQPLQSQSSK